MTHDHAGFRWIFCGGMWRSGSTLQYQIAARLVEAAGLGSRVTYVPDDEFERMAQAEERGDASASLRVVKSHRCHPGVRARLEAGTAIAVLSHRDPRDVVVSMADKESLEPTPTWAATTARRAIELYESWGGGWVRHVATYESLRDDTRSEVVRTAHAIGVACDDARSAEIAAALSREEQSRRLASLERTDAWAHAGTSSVRFDPVELLNRDHLGDGQTGKWRSRLSDETVEAVERAVGSWMLAHGYTCETRTPQSGGGHA